MTSDEFASLCPGDIVKLVLDSHYVADGPQTSYWVVNDILDPPYDAKLMIIIVGVFPGATFTVGSCHEIFAGSPFAKLMTIL